MLHGVEGVGKTSFAAHAPKPIFLMAKGETGLETLIDSGRLGEVPHLPETQTWDDALSAIEWLSTAEHPYKTLVLDTLNGFERLCHEHVCARDFSNDWSERGFVGYQRGFEMALADWRELLNAIDKLREAKRMATICLCHTKVANFKNPSGPDFDRYAPAVNAKTWELTSRWADHVLFANFYTVTEKEKGSIGKAKGKGGQDRVMYTVRHAAYDAKNRAGLPEEIDMGQGGADSWNNFMAAMQAAKAGKAGE